jgi:predicted aspartyl protease
VSWGGMQGLTNTHDDVLFERLRKILKDYKARNFANNEIIEAKIQQVITKIKTHIYEQTREQSINLNAHMAGNLGAQEYLLKKINTVNTKIDKIMSTLDQLQKVLVSENRVTEDH